jgi:hypothetical protein
MTGGIKDARLSSCKDTGPATKSNSSKALPGHSPGSALRRADACKNADGQPMRERYNSKVIVCAEKNKPSHQEPRSFVRPAEPEVTTVT